MGRSALLEMLMAAPAPGSAHQDSRGRVAVVALLGHTHGPRKGRRGGDGRQAIARFTGSPRKKIVDAVGGEPRAKSRNMSLNILGWINRDLLIAPRSTREEGEDRVGWVALDYHPW